MRQSITIKQVVEEIKHIPVNKLSEVYDLLHFFRLGLQKSKGSVEQTMKFAGCWNDMPDEVFNDFFGEIKERREQAFSRRQSSEAGID